MEGKACAPGSGVMEESSQSRCSRMGECMVLCVSFVFALLWLFNWILGELLVPLHVRVDNMKCYLF